MKPKMNKLKELLKRSIEDEYFTEAVEIVFSDAFSTDEARDISNLVELYEETEEKGRAIIDKVLVYLCGWTLPTILETAEKESAESAAANAEANICEFTKAECDIVPCDEACADGWAGITNFSMWSSIKFDRPINKETDLPSPGGYEFVFGGNEDGELLVASFDFEDSEMTIDKEDPTILHVLQKNPDYGAFPRAMCLNEENLKNVEDIIEFYIDTDTNDGSEPLVPKRILTVAFETISGSYDIATDILEKATKKLF